MNEINNSVPYTWCNILTDYSDIYHEIIADLKKTISLSKKSSPSILKQPITLLKQSHNTTDENIDIPKTIRDIYLTYRPTPFKRANRLEEYLSTNTKIFYKYEGANIAGSHKLNTAIAQAYYFKEAGIEHIITSTGAGQWGTAIAYACKLFNLKCTVFMVNVSLQQKPQRKTILELYGATVIASPSQHTTVGQKALQNKGTINGSLAIATGEAIELTEMTNNAKFAIGSGESHVMLHQTIIGKEAIQQFKDYTVLPDKIYACVGAGSNFCGISFPFLRLFNELDKKCDFIAVEPSACPKLTQGKYTYEINDFSGTTNVSKMYTLGAHFIAPSIHAGGLRYHGTSALLSALIYRKYINAVAISETDSLAAGLLFSEQEGLLPAPESAYAIAAAIQDIREGNTREKTILINISGHGLFDLNAYSDFKESALAHENKTINISDYMVTE